MDGVGDVDLVFSGAFGFEKGRVGVAHEIFCGVVGLELAQAYADRGVDLLIIDCDGGVGDHCQEALGDNEGIGEAGIWQDDGELVAAVTCGDIRFTNTI